MLMPSARACAGERGARGAPSQSSSPASACTAPAMIFIRVDLPAPFSPSTAWISPGATDSDTASLALTPGYCLLMRRSSRRGGVMGTGRSYGLR